jgi:hypothetical protein
VIRSAGVARSAFVSAVIAVTGCGGCGPKRAPPGAVNALVQDFEASPSIKKWPKAARGTAAISTEWHHDGARSLEIGPGIQASFSDLHTSDWSPFSVLRFHVHNPLGRTVELGLEIQDDHTDFSARFQRSFGVLPGDQVIELDIADGLWRGEENRAFRGDVKTPIDVARISRVGFINRGPGDLFVDGIVVEKRARVAAPGAFAFDFGKEGLPTMPQSTGVFETTLYTPERGFGMLGTTKAFLLRCTSFPSTLLGCGLGLDAGGFRVDLPGGKYLGWVAFERGGFWEGEASGYAHAALQVNGVTVHEHDFSPAGAHFLFEDTELTSLDQIEEKLVRPAAAIARFTFESKSGGNVVTIAETRSNRNPLRVAGLFLAPDTPEGHAFLDAQDRLQSEAIAASYTPMDRGRRSGGRAAPAMDVVVEPLPPGVMMYPRDYPVRPSGAPLDEIFAVRGQKVSVHLGLYARRDFTIHVAASPLAREGGKAGDPLPAPVVSHGRYLPMRHNLPGPVWLEVNHYRPEPDVTVGPELARSLLVEYELPASGGGSFSGTITLTGGPESIEIPVKIRVADVALPPIPIPVGLFMSALPFRPGAVGEPRWWELQEDLIREQARAGINCYTGGPGVDHPLRGAPGAPDPAARYLEIAGRYGPVKAAVGYGGFFPSLEEQRDQAISPDAVAKASASFPVPHYIKSYDEPATDAEIEQATALLLPAAKAGLKTIGFLTDPPKSSSFDALLAATSALSFNRHDAAEVKRREALGQHVWVYNNGLDRPSMGLRLFQDLRAGAEGRLEWIGIITQGFAFDNLDGRESSPSAWVVHDRFGVLLTPRWLAAREGLLDLRIRLALEAAVPGGDPALALLPAEGDGKGRPPDGTLSAARRGMLQRLDKRP